MSYVIKVRVSPRASPRISHRRCEKAEDAHGYWWGQGL